MQKKSKDILKFGLLLSVFLLILLAFGLKFYYNSQLTFLYGRFFGITGSGSGELHNMVKYLSDNESVSPDVRGENIIFLSSGEKFDGRVAVVNNNSKEHAFEMQLYVEPLNDGIEGQFYEKLIKIPAKSVEFVKYSIRTDNTVENGEYIIGLKSVDRTEEPVEKKVKGGNVMISLAQGLKVKLVVGDNNKGGYVDQDQSVFDNARVATLNMARYVLAIFFAIVSIAVLIYSYSIKK